MAEPGKSLPLSPTLSPGRAGGEGVWRACAAVLRRDLTLAWRRRGDIAMPVLYALIVATLFPFALGPEDALLQRIAGGVVLVTVLLAMLLALDAMFRSDIEDGSLEQLVLAPQPLALMLGMKILAHWLTTALPLILAAPLLAGMLHLPMAVMGVLMLALLLATPMLSLLGAVLVALTAGTRRSGMLLALMLLPLCVPVVIFAAGAVAAAQQGLPWVAPIAWLGAALALALVLAPLACAAALRIALDA
jgi:heme exporter protein B